MSDPQVTILTAIGFYHVTPIGMKFLSSSPQ
jgi:hypothetical protein